MCCPHCGSELVYDEEWEDDWIYPEYDFPVGLSGSVECGAGGG